MTSSELFFVNLIAWQHYFINKEKEFDQNGHLKSRNLSGEKNNQSEHKCSFIFFRSNRNIKKKNIILLVKLHGVRFAYKIYYMLFYRSLWSH